MIDFILSFIAPHLCCGCGKVGSLLCDDCKYNIIYEHEFRCLSCRKPAGAHGICRDCHLPYQRAWCVGERHGALQRLIGDYKFVNAKAAYRTLGDLVDGTIPELPDNAVIVPVPTVNSHIRLRGYDHMKLIARYIARKRRLALRTCLHRHTATKQRQAGRQQRIHQARRAFYCPTPLDDSKVYILLDDVVTTGATVRYGAQALCAAGAKHVWVVAIARQPLD
jgi:ComF family protein